MIGGVTMTSKLAIAGAVLASLLTAATAQAETKTLAEAGGWKAFGGTTNKGIPVCGVSTSPKGRYFGLKFYSGDDTFTVQMSDKEWDIKDESKYPLTMRFDSHDEWKATGAGMHFNDGDPGLEYEIRKSELDNFSREFGSSRKLRFRFRDKSMEEWTLDLNGVEEVKSEFERCNRKLK